MRAIRMKIGDFGRRGDGSMWPPFNGTIEVPDAEAERMVTAKIAVYVSDEPEAQHEGFKTLNVMLEDEPAAGTGGGGGEPGSEPLQVEEGRTESSVVGEDANITRPYTNAPKEDWIHYAISQGEPKATAVKMTKVDLVSKYGASL